MESSVAADVEKQSLSNESQTQQENDTLQERKDETKRIHEVKVKPEDSAKVEKVEDIDVYQFGDPNRYEEINKAFDELNLALSEMEESLNIIDKPPERSILEVRKNLEKNFDKLKGLDIQSIVQKEISKSEDSSGVALSPSKTSSRAEMDVAVKSPDTKHGVVTKSIPAGIVVEPQPIDKKEQSPMEDEKLKEPVLQNSEKKKDSEADSSHVDMRGAMNEAKATASEKDQEVVFHMYPPPENNARK